MSFNVAAEAYDRFMGRFSGPLAGEFATRAGVVAGQRVLDVGCGPGALTGELVRRVGPGSVVAVDPSEPFVAAAQERFPDVDVRRGSAEDLPCGDDEFDAALAQLVVHFMDDPVRGLREMGRVTRPGGAVAACVWDHAGRGSPLAVFWEAVRALDPTAETESGLAGTREGHLAELADAAGLSAVESSTLTVTVPFESFDTWWEPFTMGVGPAGAYVAALADEGRAALRDACEGLLPAAPFDVAASAWCVVAHARAQVRASGATGG